MFLWSIYTYIYNLYYTNAKGFGDGAVAVIGLFGNAAADAIEGFINALSRKRWHHVLIVLSLAFNRKAALNANTNIWDGQ